MQFQINHRIDQRSHREAIRSVDPAFCLIPIQDMESPGRPGGQHIAGEPTLDLAVEGNQFRGLMDHMVHGILGMDFSIVDTLDFQLQHVGHFIRGTSSGPKEKKVGKFLTMVRYRGFPST